MAKISCPHCGKTNYSQERFCSTCGGRMTDASIAPIGPAIAAAANSTATVAFTSGAALAPSALLNADVEGRRRAERRAAVIALGTVAALSVLRATLMPLLFSSLPPDKLEKFSSIVSPDVRMTHWVTAGAFALSCMWATRQPLHAAVTSLVLYLCYAVPDVLHNPQLIGGGHLGKLVTLGILGRAIFAGVMHRLWLDERTAA